MISTVAACSTASSVLPATIRAWPALSTQLAGLCRTYGNSASSKAPAVTSYAVPRGATASSTLLNTRTTKIPNVEGYVHSTESFSAVDGPGVRFLVFLQGCGMRCLFCSNPDTWPLHAGQKTTTKSITEEIRHVLPYIKQGGVTCSGGEPLLQPQFVSALFQEAHALGLTTCLDTTGQGTKHRNWDLVLPHTDLALFCIKHLDPIKYQKMTGVKQAGAMKFAEELARRDIPYQLRYVMVPGLSDSTDDINLLKEFALQQPTLKAIELLPYHVLGREKWNVLKLKYPLEGVQPPPRAHVLEVRHELEAAGLKVLCDVK